MSREVIPVGDPFGEHDWMPPTTIGQFIAAEPVAADDFQMCTIRMAIAANQRAWQAETAAVLADIQNRPDDAAQWRTFAADIRQTSADAQAHALAVHLRTIELPSPPHARHRSYCRARRRDPQLQPISAHGPPQTMGTPQAS